MLILGLNAIIVALSLYASGAEPSPGTSSRRLGEADDGSAIELHVGDKLAITLPANPTTGFQWEVSAIDTGVLRQTGEPQYAPAGGIVGGGGKMTLRFEAVGTGQTGLRLIYHRPFEKDVPAAKAFEVTLTVR